MESSYRPAFSPERLKNLTLLERLQLEEDTVGSPIAYLRSLGVYYEAVPDHRPNMLQLQRIARLVADPSGTTDGAPANAFYWGEILGYTLCDRMIGEPWNQMSYRLVNNDIFTLAADYEIEDLSGGENRQLFSDFLMGALESIDDTTFPAMIDEYIQQKAAALSDDPRVQHHIVMGFRYIVRQVTETATDEVNIANEFYSMMDRNEVDDLRPEFEAIDDVREHLMDRFADHVMQYGDFDETDDAALDELTDFLNVQLNRDFLKLEHVHFEDDVIVSGDALFITFRGENGQMQACALPEGYSLKGTIQGVTVLEVPTNEMIPKIRAHMEDPYGAIDGFKTNQFGVTLLLTDLSMVDGQGRTEMYDPNDHACVVLNNPALQLTVVTVE